MGATRRVSRVADSEAKPARPVQQPSKADVPRRRPWRPPGRSSTATAFLRRLRASIGPYRTVGESRRTASHSVPLVVDGNLLRLLHWTSAGCQRPANARHGQDARGTPQTREVVLPEDAHSRAWPARRAASDSAAVRAQAPAFPAGCGASGSAGRSPRSGPRGLPGSAGRSSGSAAADTRPCTGRLVGVPELRAQHHRRRAAQQRAEVLLRRPEGQAAAQAPRTPPAPECGTPARSTARSRGSRPGSTGFSQPNICCTCAANAPPGAGVEGQRGHQQPGARRPRRRRSGTARAANRNRTTAAAGTADSRSRRRPGPAACPATIGRR